MTSVWVADHGWCYLNAAIDCFAREICGWSLDVRCRAPEATAVIDRAAAERRTQPAQLTLGTDNGIWTRATPAVVWRSLTGRFIGRSDPNTPHQRGPSFDGVSLR